MSESESNSFIDDGDRFRFYEEYIEKVNQKLLETQQEKEELILKINEHEVKIAQYDEL